MLYKLSNKLDINANFFLNNVLWFFLSTFIFSRFFYIIAEWQDFKFVLGAGVIKFLLMSDYNFSLMGGVVGFMAVLFFQLRRFKLSPRKYIDAVVLSFFFAAAVGYVGAFFGGQIYGKPTDLFIGITYTNPLSTNPYTSPTLPLALFYSLASFLLFSVLYVSKVFIKIEGLIGYVGIIVFSSILLIGEFFNGNTDFFRTYIALDMTQIGSIILITLAAR